MLGIARAERNKRDLKSIINKKDILEKLQNSLENLKADIGDIASGKKIIEDYDSATGQILTEHHNDTSVVETEGYSFAKVCENRQSNSPFLFGVIRGISDISEKKTDSDDVLSDNKRSEDVKLIASDSASAFDFWLVYKEFEDQNITEIVTKELTDESQFNLSHKTRGLDIANNIQAHNMELKLIICLYP